jgi:colanic acid biosynthesis glycosyl transferase WcaI
MKIQLWTIYYRPEPSGIAPVSTVLAEYLRDRGHEVTVVAAHPHYPEPIWGSRKLPGKEVLDGVTVLRLPIWIGRDTATARMRQELSFMASQTALLPALGGADVVISASPSFPALLPGFINRSLRRRVPWVLWLHDILPDGAVTTGLVKGGPILSASRWLERASYRRSDQIVVLSRPFLSNLESKGVPPSKLSLVFDPATRPFPADIDYALDRPRPRVLSMGNIGLTQGLAPLASAFDRSAELRELDAKLIITGTGVDAENVRRATGRGQVEMLGVVSDDELEIQLREASLAVVTQSFSGTEFNLPSKLMNFMAYGLPVVAAVNPRSEVARLVDEAGCGWIADSSQPDAFPVTVAAALKSPTEMAERGRRARAYAEAHFSRDGFGSRFQEVLEASTAKAPGPSRRVPRGI